MKIDRFKREFKRLSGIYASDKVVLFRKPLELYNLATGETIATFDSLDEALAFEIDGKTLEQRVSAWTEIVFPVEHGGRGSSSGMGFDGGWPSAGGGGGADETEADLPARMNTKVGVHRTYEDMVRAFAEAHANSDIEHGVVVSELYGKVIENVQKALISAGLKNTDLSGDPSSGSVEAKRFVNASSQEYGTARAAGKGNAVKAKPVTVVVDTNREIVEEIEEKDC